MAKRGRKPLSRSVPTPKSSGSKGKDDQREETKSSAKEGGSRPRTSWADEVEKEMERIRALETEARSGMKSNYDLLSDESDSRIEEDGREGNEGLGSRSDDVEGGIMPGVDEINGKEKIVEVKPWVDVIKGNRLPSHGMSVEFVAPPVIDGEVEVEFEMEDVNSELKYWENALVLFAVGKDLSMNAVKQFMMKEWNFIALPELFYHDDGYFIARCKEKGDREHVLANGPYMIYSNPIILKFWEAGFSMKEDILRIVPVWVTFPKLPLHLWGRESLSKLASAIGKPIMTDECTVKKLRISYARVLIEIDITQELKRSVMFKDVDGDRKEQVVLYEKVPRFCQKCQKLGHDCKRIERNGNKEKGEGKEDGVQLETGENNRVNRGETGVADKGMEGGMNEHAKKGGRLDGGGGSWNRGVKGMYILRNLGESGRKCREVGELRNKMIKYHDNRMECEGA